VSILVFLTADVVVEPGRAGLLQEKNKRESEQTSRVYISILGLLLIFLDMMTKGKK
jgi:hypothetical protein